MQMERAGQKVINLQQWVAIFHLGKTMLESVVFQVWRLTPLLEKLLGTILLIFEWTSILYGIYMLDSQPHSAFDYFCFDE